MKEGYEKTGKVVVSDMRNTTEYQITGKNADQYFIIVWSKEISVNLPLTMGWNLISLPVTPVDLTLEKLFPDAEIAYKFQDGSYESVDSFEPGYGYWIKIPSDQSYTISGRNFLGYGASLSSGWHLTGAVNGISIPSAESEGAIEVMYGYSDGGYKSVARFSAGYGYWIKIKQECEFNVEAE